MNANLTYSNISAQRNGGILIDSKKKIDPKNLIEVLELTKYFDEIEDYARNKIAEEVQTRYFLGLAGVKCPEMVLDLEVFKFCFSSVKKPPGIVHICRAANLDTTDYLGVSRYSHLISNEIAILFDNHEYPKEIFKEPVNLLWHLVALIKLRGYSSIFCPAIASRSWSVIPALDNHSVDFALIENIPKTIKTQPQLTQVTQDDLTWVEKHYWPAMELRDFDNSRRFGLAFNVAYTWNHQSDL